MIKINNGLGKKEELTMRVLVVSHNVFTKTSNMGKTLSSYFAGWNVQDLAQFYIHSEVPTTHLCENYFRITDKEVLKSILSRRCGKVFGKENIEEGRLDSRTDQGLTAKVYQSARKRTPMIYLARNLIWRLGAWKNKRFFEWVDAFDPEAIFFASGDYTFIYRIARLLVKRKNIPLYTVCMDDYYLNNANEGRFLGKFSHSLFMREVHKTLSSSAAIFTICQKMATDYEKKFHKKCHVLHTPTDLKEPLQKPKKKKISYIGNLGYCRDQSLIEIGRALRSLGAEIDHIDVYSAESRPEILQNMTLENGIHFCGKINADQVKQVMAESLAVIHTESFDEQERNQVRYSISTKIADSLMSGTCILAYGPKDVASMEYLLDNQAAVAITSPEELRDGLTTLLQDQEKRETAIRNAVMLAKQNHDLKINGKLILDVMSMG